LGSALCHAPCDHHNSLPPFAPRRCTGEQPLLHYPHAQGQACPIQLARARHTLPHTDSLLLRRAVFHTERVAFPNTIPDKEGHHLGSTDSVSSDVTTPYPRSTWNRHHPHSDSRHPPRRSLSTLPAPHDPPHVTERVVTRHVPRRAHLILPSPQPPSHTHGTISTNKLEWRRLP